MAGGRLCAQAPVSPGAPVCLSTWAAERPCARLPRCRAAFVPERPRALCPYGSAAPAGTYATGSHTDASWANSTRRGSKSSSRCGQVSASGSGGPAPSARAVAASRAAAKSDAEACVCPASTTVRVGAAHHQRLVARGVPGGRHDPQSRADLGLPGQLLVPRPGEADQVVGRVRAAAYEVHLGRLHQDRGAAEQRVATDVVEVQMAVDDQRDVRGPYPGGGQRPLDRAGRRPVVRLRPRVRGADARVEEQQFAAVVDEIGERGLHPRPPVRGLGAGTDEPAEVETPYVAHDGRPYARRTVIVVQAPTCTRSPSSNGTGV